MAITYSWQINGMSSVPNASPYNSYVIMVVNWQYLARDGQYFASISGVTELDEPVNSDFIPFEQVTPDIAANWVAQKLGDANIQEMQTNLQQNINKQKTIANTNLPPPFTLG